MLVRRIAVAGAVAVTTTLIACTSVLGDFAVGRAPVATEAGSDAGGHPDGATCAIDCSKLPNVTGATCGSDGKCAFSPADCTADHADCNNLRADGCEADLGQVDNCGGCGQKCAPPTPLCSGSTSAWSCVGPCSGAMPTNCSGTCVDLQADASNCGSCGHSCQGGTCAAGACQTVTISIKGGSSGGALALTSTNVFFTDGYGTNLWMCPLTGCNGNPSLLHSSFGFAGSVAYDSKTKFVLVADPKLGTIYAYDTSGNLKWSAKSGGGSSSAPGVRGIFPDPNGYVFWGNNDTSSALLYRADNATGSNLISKGGPGGKGVMSLAYDAVTESIYAAVRDSNQLSTCKRGIGGCASGVTPPNPTGVSIAGSKVFVAVDGSAGSSYTDGGIFVATTNSTSVQNFVTGNTNYAPYTDSDLTTDLTNVYWGGRDGNIYVCAQSGCSNAPTKFSAGNVTYKPHAFANDANFVYWMTDTGLFRQAK